MSNSFFDQDFFAWAIKQARLLRAGKLSDADIEHIADVIRPSPAVFCISAL
jgi:hypothetical protein